MYTAYIPESYLFLKILSHFYTINYEYEYAHAIKKEQNNKYKLCKINIIL